MKYRSKRIDKVDIALIVGLVLLVLVVISLLGLGFRLLSAGAVGG